MPRLTLPSFVRLFQLGLAQVHSRKFMQHFGVGWDEEEQKVAVSAAMVAVSVAMVTNRQIRFFNAGMRRALDNMTFDLDALELDNYVQQAQQFKGNGLFTFVMGRAAESVKNRSRGKHSPTFVKDNVFECMIGPAFQHMWREKGQSEEREMLAVMCQKKRQEEAAAIHEAKERQRAEEEAEEEEKGKEEDEEEEKGK